MNENDQAKIKELEEYKFLFNNIDTNYFLNPCQWYVLIRQ